MNLRGLFVLSYKTIPIHRGAICTLGIWVYWCDAIQLHILRTWLVKFHVSSVEFTNQTNLANYCTSIHWRVKTHFVLSGSALQSVQFMKTFPVEIRRSSRLAFASSKTQAHERLCCQKTKYTNVQLHVSRFGGGIRRLWFQNLQNSEKFLHQWLFQYPGM